MRRPLLKQRKFARKNLIPFRSQDVVMVVSKKQSSKTKALRTVANRPKMRDVAELAGVSLQTVSNYVNGRHNQMKEETLSKVSKAMKKLNYRTNVAAASLRSQRTKTIGLESILIWPGR